MSSQPFKGSKVMRFTTNYTVSSHKVYINNCTYTCKKICIQKGTHTHAREEHRAQWARPEIDHTLSFIHLLYTMLIQHIMMCRSGADKRVRYQYVYSYMYLHMALGKVREWEESYICTNTQMTVFPKLYCFK